MKLRLYSERMKKEFICESKIEVKEIIYMCKKSIMDELWISLNGDYPCISLLLSDDLVCINYFENNENEFYFTSYNDNNNCDKIVSFIAGGEEWLAPNNAIIPLKTAIECVEQFMDTSKRPTCIKWQIL